jgi:Flp pilus assembly protein TadB
MFADCNDLGKRGVATLLVCAVRKGVPMTLSDYELRVLRELEAEFSKRPVRVRRWCGRRAVGLTLLASVVLVVLLAVFIGVAVAAPVALGCALLALAAALRTRRNRRAQRRR